MVALSVMMVGVSSVGVTETFAADGLRAGRAGGVWEAGGRWVSDWVQGAGGQQGLWRGRHQGAEEHQPQRPGLRHGAAHGQVKEEGWRWSSL